MKKMLALTMIGALLLPGVAFAGSATNAALGLGAFAVFNQILSGVGIFGGAAAAAPPVVYQPAPPPVVYQPAPPPPVVYQVPPPPAVVYQAPPAVVYEATPPPVVYRSYPAYYRGRHGHHEEHGRWCPPGLARHGRC